MTESNLEFVCRSCVEILSRPKVVQEHPEKPKTPTKASLCKSTPAVFVSWFSDDELVSDSDHE